MALQIFGSAAGSGGGGGGGTGTGSGLPSTVVTKTAAYTAAVGNFILADATTGAFTVTLPAAPAVGSLVAVKKVDVSGNVVTVTPSAGGTIDGDTTATITARNYGAVFECTSGNTWQIVAPTTVQPGPKGDTGAQGPQGIQGAQGAQGDPGTPGSGAIQARPGMRSGIYYTGTGQRGPNKPLLANVLSAVPFCVVDATTFDRIATYITAAGVGGTPTLRFGVYNNSFGIPTTPVFEATVSAAATGLAEATISQTLQPGWYWLGMVAQGATTTQPTVVAYGVAGGQGTGSTTEAVGTVTPAGNVLEHGLQVTGVTGALPAWGTGYGTGQAPIVYMRKA